MATESSYQVDVMTSALRAHMTADMMHDSLRGVVFRALYADHRKRLKCLADAAVEFEDYGSAFAGLTEEASLTCPTISGFSSMVSAHCSTITSPAVGSLSLW
jgi:methyl-accepting chemotaxis protein